MLHLQVCIGGGGGGERRARAMHVHASEGGRENENVCRDDQRDNNNKTVVMIIKRQYMASYAEPCPRQSCPAAQ